jgi:hypothetical protein
MGISTGVFRRDRKIGSRGRIRKCVARPHATERVQQKWTSGFAGAIKLALIAYTYLRYALPRLSERGFLAGNRYPLRRLTRAADDGQGCLSRRVRSRGSA